MTGCLRQPWQARRCVCQASTSLRPGEKSNPKALTLGAASLEPKRSEPNLPYGGGGSEASGWLHPQASMMLDERTAVPSKLRRPWN